MQTIHLHKDDLLNIIKFMDSFPDKEFVEITCDNSSGIGSHIQAHLGAVEINGNIVTITKDIVDESSW